MFIMTWFSSKITGVFFVFLFIYISYFLNNKQSIFCVVKIQQAWRSGKRRDGEFKSWNRKLRFIHEQGAAIEMQTQRTNLWTVGGEGGMSWKSSAETYVLPYDTVGSTQCSVTAWRGGLEREEEGSFRRESSCVHLWLIDSVVWQKPNTTLQSNSPI